MRTKHALTPADVKKCSPPARPRRSRITGRWRFRSSTTAAFARLQRMDGAPRISGEVSIGKARTSAMTGRPSKFFEDMVKARPAFVDFPGILIQGGVPLYASTTNASAASASSGVQSHEDEQIAQAGVDALTA